MAEGKRYVRFIMLSKAEVNSWKARKVKKERENQEPKRQGGRGTELSSLRLEKGLRRWNQAYIKVYTEVRDWSLFC